MLTYLLYTIFFAIANACFIKVMHISIQPGQWFDKLVGWQKMLQRLDQKGKQIVKPLGYCELCFSHLLAVVGFFCYSLVLHVCLDLWITSAVNNWFLIALINFIWYVLYVSFTTIAGLFCIKKLFANAKP